MIWEMFGLLLAWVAWTVLGGGGDDLGEMKVSRGTLDTLRQGLSVGCLSVSTWLAGPSG